MWCFHISKIAFLEGTMTIFKELESQRAIAADNMASGLGCVEKFLDRADRAGREDMAVDIENTFNTQPWLTPKDEIDMANF